MKIISIDTGRANQKLNPDEVRPVGGYYVPEAIRLLSDRYGFSQAPTLEDAIRSAIENVQSAGFQVAHVQLEPESLVKT